MKTKFQFTDDMPLAALSIGQFKELLNGMIKPTPVQLPKNKEDFPETFGKAICSVLTGYAVNTISKMICERKIPFYKKNAKVIFKREEIKEWLLSNRVQTSEEYIEQKENELYNRRRK